MTRAYIGLCKESCVVLWSSKNTTRIILAKTVSYFHQKHRCTLQMLTNKISKSRRLFRIELFVNTSSSAVTKRLRDASCLSVVSFNSTKRRVESFIVSYVDYRSLRAVKCAVVLSLA